MQFDGQPRALDESGAQVVENQLPTTSCPRRISPIASDETLPCSAVIIARSSIFREFNGSRNANSTVSRFVIENRDYASNPGWADAIASSISA